MMRSTIIALVLAWLLLIAAAVSRADTPMLVLPIIAVTDGDTIATHLTLPPPLHKVSVRVLGIDTPESDWRAKCQQEQELGAQAKALLAEAAMVSGAMAVTEFKWDMYGGRIDGNVSIGGRDVAEMLLQAGLAKPYFGKGPKPNWCAADGEVDPR